MKLTKQINMRMDEETLEKIQEMATKEKRKLSAMAKILIEEAIEAREAATNEKNA